MSSIEEKHYGNAEAIRKKIFSMYKEMVDSIRFVSYTIESDHFQQFCFHFSEAHFKPIQDEIKAETGKSVDMKNAIDVFKNSLYETIEHKLNNSWKDLEVDKSLASLSYAKETATDETKKWRPTNVDPEDQILPGVITVKNRTKAAFEKQLKYQTELIEQLVMEVEQQRGRLRLQEQRCKNTIDQITRQQEKDAKIAEQIDSVYSAMADSCESGAKTEDSWIDKSDS